MSFASLLVRTTTKVHECIEHCPADAPHASQWAAAGLRESCTALGDLLIDSEFYRFVRSEDQVVSLDEATRLLDSYRTNGNALERFLEAERELFLRAGLPHTASDHLVTRIREVINEPHRFERIELANAIAPLRDYVCGSAARFDRERERNILRGLRDAFGGLTVATLNGGLLAATVGITGALSALSVAAGSMLAADGYNAIRRLF